MQSLKDKFEELRQRLGHGRALDSTGSDPIYYLVFPVTDILEVKRQTRAWVAKLRNEDWHVVTLSLAETISSILQASKLRKAWLAAEKSLLEKAKSAGRPIDCRDINKTLAKALSEGTELMDRISSSLEEAAAVPNGLLFLTDLEALHPYLRINTIEAQLQGKVKCPVVVLYPGERAGRTSLRFLGFYPPDPNYRSEHIG